MILNVLNALQNFVILVNKRLFNVAMYDGRSLFQAWAGLNM